MMQNKQIDGNLQRLELIQSARNVECTIERIEGTSG